MKNVWKVILIIVAVMLVIGAVAFAVGLFTGADVPRIHSVLDNRYHVDMYIQYGQQVLDIITSSF